MAKEICTLDPKGLSPGYELIAGLVMNMYLL